METMCSGSGFSRNVAVTRVENPLDLPFSVSLQLIFQYAFPKNGLTYVNSISGRISLALCLTLTRPERILYVVIF
jgi:hypothetical protein